MPVTFFARLAAAAIALGTAGLAHAAAATPGNIVILYPVIADLGEDGLYLYQCSNAACSSQTQIGYVTDVPAAGVLPSVSAISFLAGSAATYQYFEETGGSWYSCKLSLNADGSIDQSNTTCAGSVNNTDNSSATAAVIGLGAAMFAQASPSSSAPVPAPSKIDFTPKRTVKFVNATKYPAICINPTAFNDMPSGKCTGIGDIKVTAQKPYTYTVPGEGLPSTAWFITGYKKTGKGWYNTGRDGDGHVYSLKLESAMYPAGAACSPLATNSQLSHRTRLKSTPGGNCAEHTVGATNIDVSAVDGYNFGVIAYPSKPAICGHSETVNGAVYSVYSVYGKLSAMSSLPTKSSGQSLTSVCPGSQLVPVQSGGASFQGCYSACTYAQVTGAANADAICCSGAYADQSACTAALDHSVLPYIANMDDYSKNVYSWAYDDNNGDFSCDPAASFTFVITN